MPEPRAWSAACDAPWRFLLSRWPWTCLLYTMVSATVGWISLACLPVLVLFPAWAVALAAVERRLVALVGLPRLAGGPPPAPDRRAFARFVDRLRSPLLRREIGYALAQPVPGLLSFVVLIIAGTAAVTGIATPVLVTTGRPVQITDSLVISGGPAAGAVSLACAVVVLGLAYVWVLLCCGQAALASALLSPRLEELQTQVTMLAQARIAELNRFERERQRVERDLHDGVQRHLAVASLHLGMLELDLRKALPAGTARADALATLDAARAETEQALDALRATVHGMRPHTLIEDGLGAALREMAARLPMPATVEVDDLRRLPAEVEASLYYVANEAVTNAVRHAAANRLIVRTATTGNRLTMTITDDGTGGANPIGGTGILGMRERASLLGGELTVNSPPGGPTTIGIEVPYMPASG
ncbi:sensor histidine kinase [Plantactinospora sp. ZYX-F-223]|uniref:sensor histidine kinase n=1 Tax=Plantactinospora sp. ZYX-F-223 TaxID=3144103 RepID=UPI0031FBCE2B